ncbi:MAG: hypothetical protein ACRC9Q_06085 [Bacteroidales bacterium]
MKKLLSVCMLAGAFLFAAPLSAQTPEKKEVKKECSHDKGGCKDKKGCCSKGETKKGEAKKGCCSGTKEVKEVK